MKNLFKNRKFTNFLQWLVLVLLVGVLAYTLFQITTDAFSLQHSGFLYRRRRLFAPAQPLGAAQANEVQSWMAIRYVNTLFRLPEPYLKTQLAVTDTRYPNISINTLAKQQGRMPGAELILVQEKIQNYFKAAPETP